MLTRRWHASAIAPASRQAALLLCVFVLGAGMARAQQSCMSTAESETASQRDLRQLAARLRPEQQQDSARRAFDSCVIGEVLKRLGDPEADAFYRKAVTGDPSNAEYRLLYGDYLRNYRGPEQPLVGAAATQYYAGLRTADDQQAKQIRRSLIALYERDGLLLTGPIDERGIRLFFSSQNTGARSPEDPGNVDLMRTLVAGALLAASPERLNRPLTSSEIDALIRNTWRGQLLERLRVRVGATNVDAYVEGHGGSGAQVADYRRVFSSANANVILGGVGVEHVMDLYPAFDLMVRGDVRWGSRYGLVESAPDAHESVRSIVGKAVASRFVGPDKINVELTVGRDDITQQVASPIERALDVVGVTARYQFYRPLLGSTPHNRPIAARGSELFAGVAHQKETFGSVDVAKRDLFAGVSFKGLPAGGAHSFDVTVQPTIFRFNRSARTTSAGPVDPFDNEQLETYATVLYRLVDRENDRCGDPPRLLFLNIVGLFSVGSARVGPAMFDRTRAGAQLDAKLVGRQQGGVTWLVSGRYERQRFAQLNRNEHVLSVSLNMGF
mgnify:CR=1 FL=1